MKQKLPFALLLFVAAVILSNGAWSQIPGLQWAKKSGGTSFDVGISIAVDTMGNVYSSGYFEDTADFDPGSGVYNLTSSGDEDFFISKLDMNGNFIWAFSSGSTGSDRCYSVAADVQGNIYVTGQFSGTVDFDPGTGTHIMTSAGGWDIFICKFDTDAGLIWARNLGGQSTDVGKFIKLDAAGDVLVTGLYSGTVDFDPGSGIYNLNSNGGTDIYITKMDSSGNFIWAGSMGGPGPVEEGQSIATDSNGNIYITGDFQSTADFDPGPATYNLVAAGSSDVFVSKLDASGNMIWVSGMGGSGLDIGYSIGVDLNDNVYIAGEFHLMADFDPGPGTYILTGNNWKNIFICKLNSAGNLTWAYEFGGITYNSASSLYIDDGGNVYTTGSFEGTTDFDPGPGLYNLIAAGSSDVFILKLNPAGNFIWAKSIGGTEADVCRSMTLDANQNIYLTGIFGDTCYFELPLTTNLVTSGSTDIFIAKYSQTSLGIPEFSTSEVINIFPNPAVANISISLNVPGQAIKITITNLTGQAGFTKSVFITNQEIIDVSELSQGMYFISVVGENFSAVNKLIISK